MADASAPQPLDRANLENILRVALREGASDLHFKAGEPVLFRVKTTLRPLRVPKLSPADTARVFEELRPAHLAHVDAATVRELDFSFAVPGAGRFRANVFRQRESVALVIRAIPKDIPDLKSLNLPDVLADLAHETRGLILVTGTTGSGKSTTLAAMINEINNARSAHVITIEDPIEFLFLNRKASIAQREVGVDTDGFAPALRGVLRQDPDVVMIGEMRDTETIDIALKAAETGHLVMSTAHTTDAARTVQRVLSVFSPAEQGMVRMRLAEALKAVVSQRLLPRADGKGLVPAVEVMINTRVIQDCIRQPERGFQINEFIARGRHYGMQAFDQHLMRLVQDGTISREVGIAAATSPADLDLKLRLGITEEEEMEIDHTHYQVDEAVPPVPPPGPRPGPEPESEPGAA